MDDFKQRFLSPYHMPTQIDSYDYRSICFFICCLVYGLAGSPTPDQLGWVEAVICLFLILSIGIGRARDAVLQPLNKLANKKRFWKSAGQCFLIYGLVMPVIIALLFGHSLMAIIRDIVPFLFLFIPLFSLQTIRARPYYFRSAMAVVCLIGLLFSLRSLALRYGVGCPTWCSDELLYLENMPTVLFSCLILIGTAMHMIARKISLFSIIVALLLFGLSLFPLMAMMVSLQRASVAAVLCYVVVISCYHFFKSPIRGIGVVLCLGVLISFFSYYFGTVSSALVLKTEKVGLNMRPQEMRAVWDAVTASPLSFLFGLGWGSSFASPAVGGLTVTFTHNFFSSVFLKTGVLGIIFSIAYISGLLERLVRVILKAPTLGFAILLPVLIDLTLYASFKSLDFGLMLLMISGSLVYLRQSESLTLQKGSHA